MSNDLDYFKALLDNDSKVVDLMYKRFFPFILRYVEQNSGDYDAACDVMQDALIVVYKYAARKQESDEEMILTTSFRNFFIAIAVKLYLKSLTGKKNTHEISFSKKSLGNIVRFGESEEYTDVEVLAALQPSIENMLIEQEWLDETRNFVWASFSKLGEACQELINLRLFKELKPAKIAEMKNTSSNYISKHYSECLNRLREHAAKIKK